MNKTFHRVIFSKTQQCLVVVSELAKTEKKSPALPKANAEDFFSQAFSSLFDNTRGQLSGNFYQCKGSHLTAQHNLHLEGKQGVNLSTAQHYYQEHNERTEKKSGFGASFSKGVAHIGYERSSQEDETTYRSIQHAGAQLTAAQGNITVLSQAGNVIAQATQFEGGKDLTVQGKNVAFLAAIDSEDNAHRQHSSSKGIGLGILYNPFSNVKARYHEQARQGSAGSLVGKGVSAADALSKTVQQLKSGVSPYLSANKKTQHRLTHTENAQVAQLNAGGNLTVRATEGNLTSQGAIFTAEGSGELTAKQHLDLGVATTEQWQSHHKKQKGIDIDLSRRPTEVVGVYQGRENADGRIIKEQASVLSFGRGATLTAEQGNLTLTGTQLVGAGDVSLSAGQDIHFKTATTRETRNEKSKSHGIGEAVISDTERFSGYNRKRQHDNHIQETHQGVMVASLNGNVSVKAGNNFTQANGQLLTNKRLTVEAENLTFDNVHNSQEIERGKSDIKFGQFSRVGGLLVELAQSLEQTSKNKNANDRVKAAQALGTAAKAYNTLYGNGALLFAESGSGMSHSRESFQSQSQQSQGNLLNGKEIILTARSGNLTAIHTDFTHNDANGNKLANFHCLDVAGRRSECEFEQFQPYDHKQAIQYSLAYFRELVCHQRHKLEGYFA